MEEPIGKKLLVVNLKPYHYLKGRNGYTPHFIELTIIECKHNVPGNVTYRTEGHHGWVAKGSDDFTYGFNYPLFNETHIDTHWHRFDTPLGDDYNWYDVTEYQCPAEPVWLSLYPFLNYCSSHQQLYYSQDNCWKCKFHVSLHKEMNLKQHKWIGWY